MMRGSWSAGATVVGSNHLLPKSRGKIVTVAPSRQSSTVAHVFSSHSFRLLSDRHVLSHVGIL